jgi:UTP--glucose-1-phosphate uridylyltransferase
VPPASLSIDASLAPLLSRYGFDAALFERLRQRLREGGGGPEENVLRGRIEPPGPEDLRVLPSRGSLEFADLNAAGERAIAAGQVGVVVLAGGMATRFGGGVKAGVEVLPGHSFLDLKLLDVRHVSRRLQARIPVYLLVSFATHEVVEGLGRAAHQAQVPIETVPQFVSLRLDPGGEPLRGSDGRLSPYACGHGDLTFALRASGALGRFRAAGGRVLFVSNVDNLAATLEPAVVGAHLAAGQAVTVEAVSAEPGDVGGAPARVDGRLQVVEAFRFPRSFPQDTLPAFNTNTVLFDAAAIDRDFELTWFRVKKKVDGQEAIQFERLMGELTAFLPTGMLVVPRHPPEGRFEPIKEPEDLERRREAIRATLTSRGLLSAEPRTAKPV